MPVVAVQSLSVKKVCVISALAMVDVFSVVELTALSSNEEDPTLVFEFVADARAST